MRIPAVLVCLLFAGAIASVPAAAETVILVDGRTQGISSIYGETTVFDDARGEPREIYVVEPDLISVVIGDLEVRMIVWTPTGTHFAPGTYAGAVRFPLGVHDELPTIAPGLNTVAVYGCNHTDGWIRVYESEFGPDNAIVRLALDFVQWCDIDPAPLFAAIRVDSAVPLTRTEPYAIAGRMQHATQGETVTLDALDSYSYEGSALSYRWVQVEGPPVELSNPHARATTFVAPAAPAGGVPLRFRLTATDAEGESDADVVTVLAHHPSDPRTRAFVRSAVGEPILAGWREYYGGTPELDDDALRYTFDEPDIDIRGLRLGTYGAQIDMIGILRPRRDRGIQDAANTADFRGMFQAPLGGVDVPGRFLNAQNRDEDSVRYPFMEYRAFGTVCAGGEIGAFDILQLDYGGIDPASGRRLVNRAAIDFIVHCFGTEVTPPLTGSFRLNSAIPLHNGVRPPLPEPRPVTVEFTISPQFAERGEPVRFAWSSTNAEYCWGSPDFPRDGPLPVSGSLTRTFDGIVSRELSLRCYTSNSAAEDRAALNVGVEPPPPPPPVRSGGGGSVGLAELLGMLVAMFGLWLRRPSCTAI